MTTPTATKPADPLALLRTRHYVALLVPAAILGMSARALATIRNGKKHKNSVAAKSMSRLMKSIASSRCHRCPAGEPAYFPLATSMPRRTR